MSLVVREAIASIAASLEREPGDLRDHFAGRHCQACARALLNIESPSLADQQAALVLLVTHQAPVLVDRLAAQVSERLGPLA